MNIFSSKNEASLPSVRLSRETGEAKNHYIYNIHGDVRYLINVNGVPTKVYDYDEFGNHCDDRWRFGGPNAVEPPDSGTENDSGELSEEEKYFAEDVYIPEESENVAVDNPYRYAGYEYIEEIGIYDLNARYYNPEIARFLSADPYYNLGNRVIGLYEINVPNAWSIIQANCLHAYCGNSPIIFFDFFGFELTSKDRQYLNDADEALILQYTEEYKEAQANLNYVGMNAAAKKAAELRMANYPDNDKYIDNYDYTHSGRIYTYSYSTEHKNERVEGNIYIVHKDIAWNSQSINYDTDFIVRDLRNDSNPAMEIMDCAKAKDKKWRLEVLYILDKHEINHPTRWSRNNDIEKMEDEWFLHIIFAIGPLKDNGEHAHLDNNEHGYIPMI